GLARHRDGALDVVDRLDRRRVERDDHDLDAGGVHQAQPLVLEVDEARPQLRPYMRSENLRVPERGRGREMVFERNFSLHSPSGHGGAAPADYARTARSWPGRSAALSACAERG